MSTQQTVNRLWALCQVLRDDGITYHEYVTELGLLLFLKMMRETGQERALPKGFRWADLKARQGPEQLLFYRSLLAHLGTKVSGHVREIFSHAKTSIQRPESLHRLVDALDALDWYSAREEGLGDLYEGLLQKNATEIRAGAGQYFTPRPLIDSIVHIMQPKPSECVLDPAAGTGGFLVAADRHANKGRAAARKAKRLLVGVELVPETHRLACMNALLHGVEGDFLLGDALSPLGEGLEPADLILTNPPFGTKKGGGLPTRTDLAFPSANKQLSFLQLVYQTLKPGGRAAVVVPENVLFEEGIAAEVRRALLEACDLHTILRLPTGIFYAPGVKTNVLFFTRGKSTKALWVFDMRTGMPSFGKRTPVHRAHFHDFEAAYGSDPYGKARRVDQGERGRFRRFTREEIRARGDHLDIAWLKDAEALPEPDLLLTQMLERLATATADVKLLRKELRGKA